MGFFSNLSRPSYLKSIISCIDAFFVDYGPLTVSNDLIEVAYFYAENKNNQDKIKAMLDDNRLHEYIALLFIFLGAKDLLKSGKYHIYAGMISGEGLQVSSVAQTALKKMYSLKYISKKDHDVLKKNLDNIMNDFSIG